MQTIAELPEYMRRAAKLLGDDERRAILDHLASHPRAGDLIEGTGGAKRANLSKAERNELAGLVDLLVQTWLER